MRPLSLLRHRPSLDADQQRLADQSLKAALQASNPANVMNYVLQGANLETRGRHGETVLMWAIRERHYSTALWLIGQGADVNARNDAGLTPLLLAAANDNPALVERLLHHGAVATVRDPQGWSARTWARHHGRKDLARTLKRYAQHNHRRKDTNPPMPKGHALPQRAWWQRWLLSWAGTKPVPSHRAAPATRFR